MIKIKYVKFYNHQIFGNQKFDFTIDGVHPINNIIIAGENGSGKTKFLEELYNISNTTFYNNVNIYSQKICEICVDISDENYCDFNDDQKKIDEAILTMSKNEAGQSSNSVKFFANSNQLNSIKKIGLNEPIQIIKINGLYSNVDINYTPRKKVEGPNDTTIDNNSNKVPNDLAFEIIQLLVNISIQDSCDIDSWIGSHKGIAPPEERYHTRLKRFTNAFKIIFDDRISYKEIRNNTIPIFKKGDNDIEISSLSSGEKQIIFRGTYLLQNKNSLKGVPVFIDEPEISMHPKWEEKIFDYYKNIFSDNGIQTSQIFIATHSEHILSNVLNNDDCLVIKIKDNTYQKFYKGGSGIVLPTITIAEIKYAIFDLYTTDFHNLLYSFVQNNYIEDKFGNLVIDPNIKETDEWLKTQNVTLKKYKRPKQNGKYYEYDTLPTYIRNCIDHPDATITYSFSELQESIDELIQIINSTI